MKRDDLHPGALRPLSAQDLTAAGARGDGLPHPSPANPRQLFTPLNLQEALPNSCADSCLQRVGPGAICCPRHRPHPALLLGSQMRSISLVGKQGGGMTGGLGKGLHKAQVSIFQTSAWAPADSPVSDPASQRSAD